MYWNDREWDERMEQQGVRYNNVNRGRQIRMAYGPMHCAPYAPAQRGFGQTKCLERSIHDQSMGEGYDGPVLLNQNENKKE